MRFSMLIRAACSAFARGGPRGRRLLQSDPVNIQRPGVGVPILAALAGTLLVAVQGLQEFSFTDYQAEVLPAVDRLVVGDIPGFLTRLPAYAGSVILDAPGAVLGASLGGDRDLWAWRLQAVPGLVLLLVLGATLGWAVARRLGGSKGTVWGAVTAFLIAGSPFAELAETTGHPEELLVVGIAVVGVLMAVRGQFITAGILIGLAVVAKPWAVVAVPIVVVAAENRRETLQMLVPMFLAGTALAAPTLIAQGVAQATAISHAPTVGIFKPSHLFWFFGDTNSAWNPDGLVRSQETDVVQAVWAQRLPVAWASRVSHPLIVVVAVLLAILYRLRRSPGHRRSPDLLLLLAAGLWWRCLLDTWNTNYYALGALVALAAWSAARGRPPVPALAATCLAWLTFQGAWSSSNTTPDIHTAIYLAWGVPFGIGMAWRAIAPRSAMSMLGRITFARVRSSADTGPLKTSS